MSLQTYNPSRKTYRRYTIKSLISFLAIIITLTIIGLVNIGEAQKKLDRIVNNINIKIVAAESMVAMIRTVDVYTRNIILITDVNVMNDELKKLQGSRDIYDSAESRLDNIFTSEEDREQINKIKELRARARPMVNHAIELGLKNNDIDAIQFLLNEVVPVNEQRLAALNELIKHQQEQSKMVARDIAEAHLRTSVLTAVLGMLALVLGVSTYIFLPSKIKSYYEGPRMDEVTPRYWS
jgi:hypothetical protein